VIALFDGRERTKLVGLLQSGKLTTWARRGVSGNDLVRVDEKIWEHALIWLLT